MDEVLFLPLASIGQGGKDRLNRLPKKYSLLWRYRKPEKNRPPTVRRSSSLASSKERKKIKKKSHPISSIEIATLHVYGASQALGLYIFFSLSPLTHSLPATVTTEL